MDPDAALAHHLEVNNPPQEGHLFAYCHKNGHRPLTKSIVLNKGFGNPRSTRVRVWRVGVRVWNV